ncbi:HAMP domain-containing histidine kinase (plasmid) [Ureibacillus chungkukjangi]|uniref:sensor histidine kinase n=1 Tax=Ureibacillus chungkukjangi TaxID=1202712 RepID=UPI000D396C1D|nr:HAMP domain-containing sensor histidine kinase [Ureibacillus chungkukjangi]MCM3390684.1 HAMP domain-containing histidine kinase [Ureibacillus chungkukjangi]
MLNKISTKLATSFFIVVFIMESFFMIYLHRDTINTRVEDEYSRLLANGANHRYVLTENYSDTTIKHILLMEMNAQQDVIITNKTGDIIGSSNRTNNLLEIYQSLRNDLDIKEDKILVSDWRNSPYIVSAHPYKINENQFGYVVMFHSTRLINEMVDEMNMHYIISGITGFIVLFIVYAILSKVLTRPLIRMKEATEKLSEGDFKVTLPELGKDELGELSFSIQKLANDLEHLKNERNEFLASIAHELSTPLTYLIGYSKVAMRKGLNDKDREHYLEIIGEESERMKDLVKNLLDLARMGETSFTISKEYFLAPPFIKNVCKLVLPSFEMKKINLNFVCDENFEIYADPIRLEQVLLNLLDNALKYSNKSSEVTIIANRKDEKTVISVIDTGIGIPSDEIGFIFEKLYRVEKSRSRAYGGSGIGLAVVKELVEAHGGIIEVESKLGIGSTFKITI